MDWLAEIAFILIIAGVIGVGTIAILMGVFWYDTWGE
jgi:hypothetical protein